MATKAESIRFAPSQSAPRTDRTNPLKTFAAAVRRVATATQMGPSYSADTSRHTGGRC